MLTKQSEKIKFRITLNSIVVLFYFLYCSIPAIQFKIDAIGNYLILLLILPYVAYFTFVKPYLSKNQVILFALLTLMIGAMYSFLTIHLNTPYPVLSYVIIFSKMFAFFQQIKSYRKTCRHENRTGRLIYITEQNRKRCRTGWWK